MLAHTLLRARRVYPRVCGGTSATSAKVNPPSGLSPRVRGNLLEDVIDDIFTRSIPACAGEPSMSRRMTLITTVYPRVCGGTPASVSPDSARSGLSPRVRGNPAAVSTAAVVIGSIPACAGEPHRRSRKQSQYRVYPRVCGGTDWTTPSPAAATGLSPRVRGNLLRGWRWRRLWRSIPACAGEPRVSRRVCTQSAVYPRVCGGTAGRPGSDSGYWGLSPRVRGNPPRTGRRN